MTEDFETYLKQIRFEKYFAKLKKKIGNKTVIIYGSGSFFQYIREKYDLSCFNVIGISDMKFKPYQEGEECFGYRIIPRENIAKNNPDFVIVATLKYLGIIEGFYLNQLKDTKTKIYPLARMPLFEMIKDIWSR